MGVWGVSMGSAIGVPFAGAEPRITAAGFGLAGHETLAQAAAQPFAYPDGLIEVPGRDLAVGIDRMLGAAESLVPRGFDGGAGVIVDAVAPTGSDDRAVVLLWRT